MSEIALLKGQNFNILGVGVLPPIYPKEVSDFYQGSFPFGRVKFSTGEPFESAYVEFTNLTVVSILNSSNGTYNLIDDSGNMISTYDASKWWTFRGHRDPNSTYTTLPPIGTRFYKLRGWIISLSGSNKRYHIARPSHQMILLDILTYL